MKKIRKACLPLIVTLFLGACGGEKVAQDVAGIQLKASSDTVVAGQAYTLTSTFVNNSKVDITFPMDKRCKQKNIFVYKFLKDGSTNVEFDEDYKKNYTGCSGKENPYTTYSFGSLKAEYVFYPEQRGIYTVVVTLKSDPTMSATTTLTVK